MSASATPCWRRVSRRSSTLVDGDRCIAASRSSSATRSSAPGILLSARTRPRRGSPTNWRPLPRLRPRVARPGAAAELAELSISLTPADAAGSRQAPAAASRRRPSLRERRRGAKACDPRAAPRAAAAWCRACGCVAAARRALGRRLEKSERLLEQAFAEAEADPRLRAEIVMRACHHGVSSPWGGGGSDAGAGLGSGRGGQRGPRPARDLPGAAQLAELYAEGVTPGVLERALELEELVGPLPTYDARRRCVEGMRLMYADEHEPAREALQRAHAVGVARGDEPARTTALFYLAVLECRAGEWSRADEYAEELLEEGEQRGLDFRVDCRCGSGAWSMPTSAASTKLTRGRSRASRARMRRAPDPSSSGPCAARSDRHVHGRLPRSSGEAGSASSAASRNVARGEPSHYPARELAIEASSRSATSTRPASSSNGWTKLAAGSGPRGRWRWARAVAACWRRPRATSKRRSQAASERWRCTSGCRCLSSAPAPAHLRHHTSAR